MKPINLNPEYKKWFLTICLVATLGFNLSHLIGQPDEGTTDLASNDFYVNPDTGDVTSHPPRELGRSDAPKPAERKEANFMPGYIKSESGSNIPVSITKRDDDAVTVTIVDGYKDPRCKDGENNAVDGKCLQVIVRIAFKNDAETKKKIEEEAQALFFKGKSSVAKKDDKKEDKKENDKKAKALLEEIESECGGMNEKTRVSCYARNLERVLKEEDNRKVLTDDHVTTFINDNVAGPLKEAIIKDKYSSDSTDLVEKLQKSLRGRFPDARKAIETASIETIKASRQEYVSKIESVRELRFNNERINTEIQALTKSPSCTNDPMMFQMCQQQIWDLQKERTSNMWELGQMQRELPGLNAKIRKYGMLLKTENSDGLKYAVSNYGSLGMDGVLKDSLLRFYDNSLSSLRLDTDLLTLDSTLASSGRIAPSQNRGSVTTSTQLRDDIRFLKPGSRIQLPTGITIPSTVNNGIPGRPAAPAIGSGIVTTMPFQQPFGLNPQVGTPFGQPFGTTPLNGFRPGIIGQGNTTYPFSNPFRQF